MSMYYWHDAKVYMLGEVEAMYMVYSIQPSEQRYYYFVSCIVHTKCEATSSNLRHRQGISRTSTSTSG